MGVVGRIKKIALGGFIGAAILGLVGCCCYSSLYCSHNNPYLTYYPGRKGKIGAVAYVIAITSIVSLAFFLVSFVFNILKKFYLLNKIITIIGTLIYIACFISEILFIVWNDWDLDKSINELLNNSGEMKKFVNAFKNSVNPLNAFYDQDFDSDFGFESAKIPGVSLMAIRSPPTFGKVEAFVEDDGTIVKKEINMPVCYFKTLDDKLHYRPEKCIGKWDGEKIHDYIDELNEKIKQDIERRNWAKTKRLKWHFKWNYNNIIMYSQPGSHALMIIFLCIQVGAIACGIVYFVIAAKQHYENDEGSYVYQ